MPLNLELPFSGDDDRKQLDVKEYKPSDDRVTAGGLILRGAGSVHDAEYTLKYALGEDDVFKQEMAKVLTRFQDDSITPPRNAKLATQYARSKEFLDLDEDEDPGDLEIALSEAKIPNPDKIVENLKHTAKALQELRERFPGHTLKITSGLRTPTSNGAAGGSFASRHQAGLAADVVINEPNGSRVPPSEVADRAKQVVGPPGFAKAIMYPPLYDDGTFTHLALPRGEDAGSYQGRTLIFRKTNVDFVRVDAHDEGAIETQREQEYANDHDVNERQVTLIGTEEYEEERATMTASMGVRTGQEDWLEGPDESVDLPDRGAPPEGAIDIGDLRFGEIKFDEKDPSELNQPTSIGQQSNDAVGATELLRTDMNPIIAENKGLPETVLTITLNASTRDDVNKRLRPLIAMHRRMPFCAARNRDLARMMLGLSVSEDIEGRIQELHPNASEDQLEEIMDGVPDDLANMWVPVTLRHISVDTQPGAPNVFQVHVIMRYANIQPYVPRMQFWKNTKDAIEWARYQSLRSTQGAEVKIPGAAQPSKEQSSETEPGTATTILPTGSVVTATPPSSMGEKQTDSPYKSYPFRKMYRGLLEEFQPEQSGGFYDAFRAQDEYEPLRPIASTEDGEVYEPGYPIADPRRAFEEYDSSIPIGLEFITVSGERTPQARLQSIVQAFEERINLADRLDAAVSIADLAADDVKGLEEAGKVSPVIVGPGEKLGKVMLSINQTADAFKKAASEISSMSDMRDIESQMSETFTGFKFDTESGELTTEEQEVRAEATTTQSLIDEDLEGNPIAEDALQPDEIFSRGGLMDFKVPDRKHEEVYIPFSDRLEKLQKGILASFVNLMARMGKAGKWGSDFPDKFEDAEWSPWFDEFMGRQIRSYIGAREGDLEQEWQSDRREMRSDWSQFTKRTFDTETPPPEFGRKTNPQYWGTSEDTLGFTQGLPEDFGSYMLTFRFIQKLLEATEHWERLSQQLNLTSNEDGEWSFQTPEAVFGANNDVVLSHSSDVVTVRPEQLLGQERSTERRFEGVGREPTGSDKEIKIPATALGARRDLESLLNHAREMSQLTNQAIRNSRGAVEEHYKEAASSTYGYLALQNATIENMHLRFKNRFGDREWEGYPQEVTQHLGGGNAEVTIEMTTNNKLLLDQLGELKRSQQTLAEKRKTEDVVPPLMGVAGEGNLLRAHGINHLAYRNHTINMAEQKPGYYKIRLDLIQDEKTLIRSEQFRRVGGTRDQQIAQSRATAPITIPIWARPGGQARPVGIYDLWKTIYPDVPDEPPAREEFEVDEVYPAAIYDRMEDPSLTDMLNRTVVAADVTYNPPSIRDWSIRPRDIIEGEETELEDYEMPAMTANVTWRTEDGNTRRTTNIDVTHLFRPLIGYLDMAEINVDTDTYRRLVQRVEGAVETTGNRNGLLVAYMRIAKARAMEYDTTGKTSTEAGPRPWIQEAIKNPENARNGSDEEAELKEKYQDRYQIVDSQYESEENPDVLVRNQEMFDNVTKMVRRIAKDEDIGTPYEQNFVRMQTASYLLAATELTSSIFGGADAYSHYQDWLENLNWDMPGLERGQTISRSQTVHAEIISQQRSTPTAYMDLLLPNLRDPAQDQTNILGPDFPFGPGEEKLYEDVHLHNYKIADTMRQAAALKMATVGFDALAEYLPDGVSEAQNVDALNETVNEVVGDISGEMADRLEGRAPFNLSDEGDALEKMVETMESNAAFNGEFGSSASTERLNTDDLVQALQISKTLQYTTKVMETAAEQSSVKLVSDDGELNIDIARGESQVGKDGDKVDYEKLSPVARVIRAAKEGESPILGQAGNPADATAAMENTTRVQDNSWLTRQREELIKLYEADDQVISQHLGYYDKYTEPRRARLRKKLGDSWTEWKGMRKAFPSYMLIAAGQLGTGLGDVLSDLYSWTAAQELEIRDLAGQAGQYANLRLSNMRKRIQGSNTRGGATLLGEFSDDQGLKITPGSHMHLYMGYGPDPAHMNMMAGRVTGKRPGPITELELSSYSTTLSNPPTEGRGFNIDGWSGQQSIAETVLYTISQTSGLEGLGRQAPGKALDQLGREARGYADEDYRSSVVVDLYREFGSPGLGWMFEGEEQARSGSVLDMVARYGTDQVKQMVLGDPAIYENVWISAAREQSGPTDFFFGGLADYATGGKGWGWAALPGQTAWAQLKDQSKLFADYVVTTRPYNSHVPLSDQARHPPRQTLYFGPKSGNYIFSSQEPNETDSFLQYTQEELDAAITQARQDSTNTSPEPTSDVFDRNTSYLYREYQDLVVEKTLLPVLLRTLSGGEGGNIYDTWSEELYDTLSLSGAGTPGSGFEDVGTWVDFLESRDLTGDRKKRLDNVMHRLFPNTFSFVDGRMFIGDLSKTSLTAEAFLAVWSLAEYDISDPTVGLEALSVDWDKIAKETPAINAAPEIGDDVVTSSPTNTERVIAHVMKQFRKDLVELASDPGEFANLTNNDIESNPLVQQVRQTLLEQGLIPSRRMKPIQKHHFANMYDSIAGSNVKATDQHPDFANRVTLNFPADPDQRMAAYFGQQGEQNSYSVQVSPTINEDYITESQIYYPNLKFGQAEAAGMIASQLEVVQDGGPSFNELVDARSEIKEALADGQQTVDLEQNLYGGGEDSDATLASAIYQNTIDWTEVDGLTASDLEEIQSTEPTPQKLLGVVSSLINDRLTRLAPFYTRPKYSTVAVNMLQDRFRHMYDGDLILAGNPSLKPYHMIHLWDDVNEMQGPAEVEGVYHRFDADQGFYTMAKPKLASYVRGTDEGMDTQWMSQAAKVTHTMNWATRVTDVAGKMMGFASRGLMYSWAASGIASAGKAALSAGLRGTASTLFSLGRGGIGAAAGISGVATLGPIGAAIAVADAVYTAGEYFYETGQDRAGQYIGMINGAMDSNPLIFLPLSYKGRPFTAGLTGATGPASMTRVATDELDDNGDLTEMKPHQIFEKLTGVYDPGSQAPQTQ